MLGITKHRYLLEVEIKRSMADFRADAAKRHIEARAAFYRNGTPDQRGPKQFWYLVPENLWAKVAPELPEWAGLLTPRPRRIHDVDEPAVWCNEVKSAPVNRDSKPLTTRQCVILARLMANQIWSFADTLAAWERNRYHRVEDYSI